MPEYALAAAGVFVFALTTWASLVFGYEVFQHIWEADPANDPDPAPSSTDDGPAPVPVATVDPTSGDVLVPGGPVHPAAPGT